MGAQRRGEIAAVFGIPAQDIRVISPFVGGPRLCIAHWPHVTLAASATGRGRPIKVMLSRREMYYGVGYRPHTVQRVALGAPRDGRLAAIEHEGHQETSTYEEFRTRCEREPVPAFVPNVYTRHRVARINVHTPTFMRAPGEAGGVFALETAMDELAVALNVDPVELRLRNEPEQDEFKKLPFSSRSTRECYRAAAERFGWSRRNPEPRAMRDGRWLNRLGHLQDHVAVIGPPAGVQAPWDGSITDGGLIGPGRRLEVVCLVSAKRCPSLVKPWLIQNLPSGPMVPQLPYRETGAAPLAGSARHAFDSGSYAHRSPKKADAPCPAKMTRPIPGTQAALWPNRAGGVSPTALEPARRRSPASRPKGRHTRRRRCARRTGRQWRRRG